MTDHRDALSVVRGQFLATRRHFVESGYKRCKAVRFELDPDMHDSPRHFAACRHDGKLILCAPELADQEDHTIVAIMYHEFGHATDFLYRMTPKSVLDSDDEDDKDEVERMADRIAEDVSGLRIRYHGPLKLQSFEHGRLGRPKGLR
jgi:hypothetical protein